MKDIVKRLKAISIILPAGLIFGFAGQSMAVMDDSDLILGIYNKDYIGNEIIINLGDVSEIDFTASDVVLSSAICHRLSSSRR